MSLEISEKEKCIKDNGTRKPVNEMGLEYNFGQMGQSMKECGEEIRIVEKEE